MREPYNTLLGGYHDHWWLGRFLAGDEPDFAGIMAARPFGVLSTGELIMCHVGLAIWNGDRTARIADLAGLDDDHLRRVLDALDLICRV